MYLPKIGHIIGGTTQKQKMHSSRLLSMLERFWVCFWNHEITSNKLVRLRLGLFYFWVISNIFEKFEYFWKIPNSNFNSEFEYSVIIRIHSNSYSRSNNEFLRIFWSRIRIMSELSHNSQPQHYFVDLTKMSSLKMHHNIVHEYINGM